MFEYLRRICSANFSSTFYKLMREKSFWFYLVRGTSSLWSSVTGEDLLSTEGVKVTKASVLLVGEQEKSDPAGLVGIPLD